MPEHFVQHPPSLTLSLAEITRSNTAKYTRAPLSAYNVLRILAFQEHSGAVGCTQAQWHFRIVIPAS